MNNLVDYTLCAYYERWCHDLRQFSVPTRSLELSTSAIATLRDMSQRQYSTDRNHLEIKYPFNYGQTKSMLRTRIDKILLEFEQGVVLKVGNKASAKSVLKPIMSTRDIFQSVCLSDRVWNEIEFLHSNCSPIFATFKQYNEIEPCNEWKCIIKNRELMRIVPRKINPLQRCSSKVKNIIEAFFRNMFYLLPCDNILMDVYISEGVVVILGFDSWLLPDTKQDLARTSIYEKSYLPSTGKQFL